MSSVVAVVVSYNRRALLRRCLDALDAQTRRPESVLVVDNGSSDGSREMVLADFPHMELVPLGSNLGGAGGFSFGVDRAISDGHDWAWLMDDDAAPEPDALELLVAAAESSTGVPFVAPAVVDDESGGMLAGHERASSRKGENGYPAADSASFVGVLVSLEASGRSALPIADFFILHDDLEYTARLARSRPGLLVRAARIRHPNKPEMRDLGWRLYPELRNQIWLLRIRGLGAPGLRRGRVRALLRRVAGQALHSQDKVAYVRCVARAVRDGVTRTPRVVRPGEVAGWLEPRFVVRP